MPTRARRVLADCEHALRDFEASANSEVQWTRWLALITLLRTVLDVLEKVDAPQADSATTRRIREERSRLFRDKPEPRIYHLFIEDERNDAVHRYDVGAAVDVTISFAPNLPWMPVMVGPSGGMGTTTSRFFMRDGPFAGRDPRELCREAIAFWRNYLDRVETTAFQDRS